MYQRALRGSGMAIKNLNDVLRRKLRTKGYIPCAVLRLSLFFFLRQLHQNTTIMVKMGDYEKQQPTSEGLKIRMHQHSDLQGFGDGSHQQTGTGYIPVHCLPLLSYLLDIYLNMYYDIKYINLCSIYIHHRQI